MKILLNGVEKSFDFDSITIKDLTTLISIDRETIVAELNGEIVASEEFGNVTIKDGDKLELIRFVGGG
ncbi:MAG: thiamine biosynthesis protein ThiS [Candidatus Cloacimonadota bacterium]|nr:MAG: thiamine biosynthesis protein ThiS [Candidatus Cloacimonadota bacterium]PIE77789.1 MAG: thiamine biosynthesis protein ThiS [Candidatus Delongbacteria bacterium]